MGGPEKPFSCVESGCGASFTNEDRLSVHARKHDMSLQLGNKGGAYVADQTPTPTRFIRNCEEVGLFQDLQNVNPFDETFKRAMEVRTGNNHLMLDENVIGTTSDDTLHTPHIFPHLPDENAAGLYASNAERTILPVSRLSSDEGSNQLTVVKCLSSSVEDNLSTVDLQETDKDDKHYRKTTVLVERKIKKKSDSANSKLKLTRQNSIDIPDDINSANFNQIKNSVVNKDSSEKSREMHVNLRDDRSDIRIIQIPLISISEISKSNNELQNIQVSDQEHSPNRDNIDHPQKLRIQKPNSFSEMILSKKDGKFLDVTSCLKNDCSKLISQKSIDMALVNFTNEAQNKLLDMNSISIEDLPDSTSVIKESVTLKNSCEVANEVNVQILGKRKRFEFSKSKSASLHLSTDTQKMPNLQQTTSESAPIISIEGIGENAVLDNSGYELMLKWPDGKKIYLKEVHRDENDKIEPNKSSNDEPTQLQSLSNLNNEEIILKPNVKQKLKDMISSNSEKQTGNVGNIVLNPLPLQNSITILPENYMLLPQITTLDTHVPVSTVMSSNVQYIPIVSPPQIQIQPILIPTLPDQLQTRKIIQHSKEKITLPLSRKSGGGNLYSGDEISILPNGPLNPTIATPPKGIKKKSPNEKTIKKKTDDGQYQDKTFDDTLKRQLLQERNRASVSRYREKKQNKYLSLQDNYKKLEKMNMGLMENLQEAMKEIERLRTILAQHNNCQISSGNNIAASPQSVIFTHISANNSKTSTTSPKNLPENG